MPRPRATAGAVVTRLALLVTGAMVVAGSVAVLAWNDLGPGPIDALIIAIGRTTGIPLSVAVWLTVGSLSLVAWRLGRRPGAGTFVAPLVIGPVLQLVLSLLDRHQPPGGLHSRVLLHVVAIAGVGLGAAMIIGSCLGAGMQELLAGATADRSGRSEPGSRLAFELAWVALAIVLSGPVGVGTVLFAVLIGPAVHLGLRCTERVARVGHPCELRWTARRQPGASSERAVP